MIVVTPVEIMLCVEEAWVTFEGEHGDRFDLVMPRGEALGFVEKLGVPQVALFSDRGATLTLWGEENP
jgi:hypothetical protein